MKVGFLLNQIDNRGTGNAVYDYAHYNEEILGNKSLILVRPTENNSRSAVLRFTDRFKTIYHIHENIPDIDVLYHIKSGSMYQDDYIKIYNVPLVVHAVFEIQPHGDRYAAVSEWLGNKFNVPFVPHIIEKPEYSTNNFVRKFSRVPDDAVIFGRYGGYDTFDISWVWDTIQEILDIRDDVWFYFANTPETIKHPRIKYFNEIVGFTNKFSFVESSDAMLHARARGETFGISVGEFAIQGKPIITYGQSYEKAHIYELRGTALTYDNQNELREILLNFKKGTINHPFYDRFTPELVMKKFKEVFLDGL